MIELSVVLVTYNRSALLCETIESLREALGSIDCSYELIVADDCSSAEHRVRMDSFTGVIVARTTRNLGVGANVNNGISHSSGRLILQIQDDWKYSGTPAFLRAALAFLGENADVGIVQLTAVGTDLPVDRRSSAGYWFQVFKNDRIPWMRGCGVRPYSDQPHIKRREFADRVGAYLEGVPMTLCENEYKHRVANQTRWKVAMIEGAPSFTHLGRAVSFNLGGGQHRLLQVLYLLPWGKKHVEPRLRNVMRRADHLAAKLMAR